MTSSSELHLARHALLWRIGRVCQMDGSVTEPRPKASTLVQLPLCCRDGRASASRILDRRTRGSGERVSGRSGEIVSIEGDGCLSGLDRGIARRANSPRPRGGPVCQWGSVFPVHGPGLALFAGLISINFYGCLKSSERISRVSPSGGIIADLIPIHRSSVNRSGGTSPTNWN